MNTLEMIALVSSIAAMLSVLVNLIPILRDRPKIDFSFYITKSVPIHDTAFATRYYNFKIVNSGRRPVTVVSVGATKLMPYYKWIIYKLTRFLFRPEYLTVNAPQVENWLQDLNLDYKTFKEGETAQAHLELTINEIQRNDFINGMNFYAEDSKGKKYYLPHKAYKLYQRDIKQTYSEAMARND